MKVAIAGYGIEGVSSYMYWKAKGDEITIVDERTDLLVPDGATVKTGKGVFTDLHDFDLVIRTAGLPPRSITTDGTIWSATNEFFAQCPAPIIGVTGTKGKGTTSSLIASILREAGFTVHLVGNIGQPALEVLASISARDIVVYELSSFQLWDLQASPHVAVVLMIEPDHLDMHLDMDEYVDAKSHIIQYQTEDDIVIYNRHNSYASRIAHRSAAKQIAYPESISEFRESLTLPGLHNEQNASAAILASRVFTNDNAAIHRGLDAFTGLPHRLKYVGSIHNVAFYDDSIATTPGSALAAISSFVGPKVLILGGSDKGADYQEIVRCCKDADVTIVAIGQTGEKIVSICQELEVSHVRVTGNMTEIVKAAFQLASPGATILLSPASASFDMFKNYADRGEQFITAVHALESSLYATT